MTVIPETASSVLVEPSSLTTHLVSKRTSPHVQRWFDGRQFCLNVLILIIEIYVNKSTMLQNDFFVKCLMSAPSTPKICVKHVDSIRATRMKLTRTDDSDERGVLVRYFGRINFLCAWPQHRNKECNIDASCCRHPELQQKAKAVIVHGENDNTWSIWAGGRNRTRYR